MIQHLLAEAHSLSRGLRTAALATHRVSVLHRCDVLGSGRSAPGRRGSEERLLGVDLDAGGRGGGAAGAAVERVCLGAVR